MGAIQNSINMAGASVAAAAIGIGRELDKQKETNIENQIKAKDLSAVHQEQLLTIDKETKDTEKEVQSADIRAGIAKQDLEKAKQGYEDLYNNAHPQFTEGKKKGKFMSKEDKKKELTKKRHDMDKLRLASKELEDNLTAKKAQLGLVQKRMADLQTRIEAAGKQLGEYGYVKPTLPEKKEKGAK